MLVQIIIVIVSLFLDGILSNFLPFMLNDLSLFTPFFTIVSIVAVCPFFKRELNKYYIFAFITGFLYDLFYTNLFLVSAIFFFLISLIISFIYKKIALNFITNLFLVILSIVIYHSMFSLALFIFNVVPVDIKSTFYLIRSSIILNVFYGEILYLFCKSIPLKRHLN